MSQKTVLQLGAGQLMGHSIRLLREIGLRVYAVDGNPKAPGFTLADGSAPIDIVDPDAVAAYAEQIGADVILAVNEFGVLSASEASQRLGLPSIPPDVALRCLDKGLMRDCWKLTQLPQPEYRVVQDPQQIAEAAAQIGYPVILKPAVNCGSRGVSFVAGPDDLPWATEFASVNCRNERYVVEACIHGTEMTIEGLVQRGKPQILAKSDKEPQHHPKYRVALALNYPAQFSAWQLELADEIVTQAALALGIENGAFHCECMINGEGIYLIEMGARGGGRTHLWSDCGSRERCLYASGPRANPSG